MKMIITGGGTGGHTMPAISVGLAALNSTIDVLYIGSERGIERKLAEDAGITFEALEVYPLGKPWTPKGIRSLFKLWQAIRKAKKIMDDYQPDIVFGTGGYAAAAVFMAQIKRKGKFVIHEQNAIAGRVNKSLGKKADLVCVAFPEAVSEFPKTKVEITGMPLRDESVKCDLTKEQSRIQFGLYPSDFTVLIIGGSQGSLALNEAVSILAQRVPQNGIQWLHVTGPAHYSAIKDSADRMGMNGNYKVVPFLNGSEVGMAYNSADMIICRSGASTVSEVTCWGLPAVFIPYPYAFADHQRFNAMSLVNHGAAELVIQKDATPEKLSEIVLRWKDDKKLLETMSANMKPLAIWDATDKVMKSLLKLMDDK